MDAFFASVEQASNPYLKGKAIIVTGKGLRHSVVTTASYEAKRKGVRSGMPAHEALKLCPEAIPVEADGKKYEYVSREIMKLLHSISPEILVTSIDEAYIDLAHFENLKEALRQLKGLKLRLIKEFGLTASIGIAANPILAKIGSDFRKPDGFVVICRGAEKEFLKQVDVKDIPGIGPHTLIKLSSYGYEKAIEFIEADDFFLYSNFGNALLGLKKALLACSFSRAEFFKNSPPKSIGHSMTLSRNIEDGELLKRVACFLGAKVIYRMRRKGFEAEGVSLFLKYSDFSAVRTSRKLNFPLSNVQRMNQVLYWLIEELWNKEPIRALGVSCNRLKPFNTLSEQLSFLGARRDLMDTSLKIEEAFGKYSLFPASILVVSEL
ncbi:DNA polymerase Y family protein [Kosmotoga arenicorallina]|nr:DNA polymerase IV [Kosmotoga arenicorallina]